MAPRGLSQNGTANSDCQVGLLCACLALNRGLHVCTRARVEPPTARRFQRRGLSCEPRLPKGLRPLPAVPLGQPGLWAASTRVVDPRRGEPSLARWALGPARGFYTRFAVVRSPRVAELGIPVLAGDDVAVHTVEEAASTLQHLLVEAAVDNSTLEALAQQGVRVLIAGEGNDAWLFHPEVSRHFVSGLGGGAPWFPSTGIKAGEPANILAEELFHTIQYVAMKPRAVCMYHRAYRDAIRRGLYTTDGSSEEVDGEPVPTVQADEYLAMALQRWLGSNVQPAEYKVPGSGFAAGAKTGREQLRQVDPQAFCLIAQVFRSDDIWNPDPKAEPWRMNPNRGMDLVDVEKLCTPLLECLADGCPANKTEWSHAR